MVSFSFMGRESRSSSILNAPTQDSAVPVASSVTSNFIDSLLDKEIERYESYGFFSSYYQPSLQATYQAICILNDIGCLSQVDEIEISDYIMKYYTNNNSFIDSVALRYLDADFSQQYYPLQTYMEITCYAVLTLNILDQLDRIDVQQLHQAS